MAHGLRYIPSGPLKGELPSDKAFWRRWKRHCSLKCQAALGQADKYIYLNVSFSFKLFKKKEDPKWFSKENTSK